MKHYIIHYKSKNKWQKEKGTSIIIAQNRQEAMLLFKKTVKERIIIDISILKPKKGILFNQDVSIL